MGDDFWMPLGLGALAVVVGWRLLRTLSRARPRRRLSARERRIEALRSKIDEKKALKAARERSSEPASPEPGRPDPPPTKVSEPE